MKVADILDAGGAPCPIIKPTDSVATLSRHLQRRKIAAMVVSRDGRSVDGIVTERDIAYGLAHHHVDLPALPVAALMTRRVVACGTDETLAVASRLMAEHHVHYLPVHDGDRLVGLISMRDVLEHRLEELRTLTSKIGSLASGG